MDGIVLTQFGVRTVRQHMLKQPPKKPSNLTTTPSIPLSITGSPISMKRNSSSVKAESQGSQTPQLFEDENSQMSASIENDHPTMPPTTPFIVKSPSSVATHSDEEESARSIVSSSKANIKAKTKRNTNLGLGGFRAKPTKAAINKRQQLAAAAAFGSSGQVIPGAQATCSIHIKRRPSSKKKSELSENFPDDLMQAFFGEQMILKTGRYVSVNSAIEGFEALTQNGSALSSYLSSQQNKHTDGLILLTQRENSQCQLRLNEFVEKLDRQDKAIFEKIEDNYSNNKSGPSYNQLMDQLLKLEDSTPNSCTLQRPNSLKISIDENSAASSVCSTGPVGDNIHKCIDDYFINLKDLNETMNISSIQSTSNITFLQQNKLPLLHKHPMLMFHESNDTVVTAPCEKSDGKLLMQQHGKTFMQFLSQQTRPSSSYYSALSSSSQQKQQINGNLLPELSPSDIEKQLGNLDDLAFSAQDVVRSVFGTNNSNSAPSSNSSQPRSSLQQQISQAQLSQHQISTSNLGQKHHSMDTDSHLPTRPSNTHIGSNLDIFESPHPPPYPIVVSNNQQIPAMIARQLSSPSVTTGNIGNTLTGDDARQQNLHSPISAPTTPLHTSKNAGFVSPNSNLHNWRQLSPQQQHNLASPTKTNSNFKNSPARPVAPPIPQQLFTRPQQSPSSQVRTLIPAMHQTSQRSTQNLQHLHPTSNQMYYRSAPTSSHPNQIQNSRSPHHGVSTALMFQHHQQQQLIHQHHYSQQHLMMQHRQMLFDSNQMMQQQNQHHGVPAQQQDHQYPLISGTGHAMSQSGPMSGTGTLSQQQQAQPNITDDNSTNLQGPKARINLKKWEEDEMLGENASIASILFANVTFPDLKISFPDFQQRAKEIQKIWRRMSLNDRNEWVGKARANRNNQKGQTIVTPSYSAAPTHIAANSQQLQSDQQSVAMRTNQQPFLTQQNPFQSNRIHAEQQNSRASFLRPDINRAPASIGTFLANNSLQQNINIVANEKQQQPTQQKPHEQQKQVSDSVILQTKHPQNISSKLITYQQQQQQSKLNQQQQAVRLSGHGYATCADYVQLMMRQNRSNSSSVCSESNIFMRPPTPGCAAPQIPLSPNSSLRKQSSILTGPNADRQKLTERQTTNSPFTCSNIMSPSFDQINGTLSTNPTPSSVGKPSSTEGLKAIVQSSSQDISNDQSAREVFGSLQAMNLTETMVTVATDRSKLMGLLADRVRTNQSAICSNMTVMPQPEQQREEKSERSSPKISCALPSAGSNEEEAGAMFDEPPVIVSRVGIVATVISDSQEEHSSQHTIKVVTTEQADSLDYKPTEVSKCTNVLNQFSNEITSYKLLAVSQNDDNTQCTSNADCSTTAIVNSHSKFVDDLHRILAADTINSENNIEGSITDSNAYMDACPLSISNYQTSTVTANTLNPNTHMIDCRPMLQQSYLENSSQYIQHQQTPQLKFSSTNVQPPPQHFTSPHTSHQQQLIYSTSTSVPNKVQCHSILNLCETQSSIPGMSVYGHEQQQQMSQSKQHQHASVGQQQNNIQHSMHTHANLVQSSMPANQSNQQHTFLSNVPLCIQPEQQQAHNNMHSQGTPSTALYAMPNDSLVIRGAASAVHQVRFPKACSASAVSSNSPMISTQNTQGTPAFYMQTTANSVQFHQHHPTQQILPQTAANIIDIRKFQQHHHQQPHKPV